MTTDRRQIRDRRLLPTRTDGSGRRETDREPQHGTRARYGRGCKCVSCRSANAAYESEYRRLKREGKSPLGAKVASIETWRLIRQLKADDVSEADIAQRTGLSTKRGQLRLATGRHAVVTLRSALLVQRVFREFMVGAEGAI